MSPPGGDGAREAAPYGRRLVRAILALLLFGLTAEVTMRLALRHRGVRLALDARTEAGAILAAAGEIAHGDHGQGLFVPDARLGWRMRPGVHVHQPGPTPGPLDATITVGPEGWRHVPPAHALHRPRRVIGLGDSFAFGAEVSDHETWAAEVQRQHEDVRVDVLAAPGWSHASSLVALQDDALRDPDTEVEAVVVILVAIDVLRNQSRFTSWWLPRFHPTSTGLRFEPVPVGTHAAHAAHVLGQPILPHLVRLAGELVSSPDPEAAIAVTDAILRRLRDLSAARGAPLLLVFTPSEPAGVGSDPHVGPADRPGLLRPLARALCTETGVRCIDTHPAFAALATQGIEAFRGVHWSPAGQAAVGAAIAQAL